MAWAMYETVAKESLLKELQESADYHLEGHKVAVRIPEDGAFEICVIGLQKGDFKFRPWLMGAEEYRDWTQVDIYNGKHGNRKCKVYRYAVGKPTTFESIAERHVPDGMEFTPKKPCEMVRGEEAEWRKTPLYMILTGRCGA